MLRDLLSSQWFQGGLIFFLLCVGGSLLYSWHVLRTTESDMERHDRFLLDLQKQNGTRPTEVVNEPTEAASSFVSTPEENTDTPMSDETEVLPYETESLDIADAFLPDDLVSEEAAAEDVSVSPFGFGPYPEVPEAFIQKVGSPPWLKVGSPPWFKGKRHDLPEDTKRGIEIISRVLIKLWKQGDESINGGIRDSTTGFVYPFYDNTIYIKRQIVQRDSKDRMPKTMINNIISPPGLMISAEDMQKLQESGDPPDGIRVLDFNTTGIDPSQFLNIR